MTKRYFAVGALLFAQMAFGCGGGAEDGDPDAAGTEPPEDDAGHAGGEDAGEGPGDAGSQDRPDANEDDARVGEGGTGPGNEAKLDDVDLTLGGFNQELPAPAGDCVNRTKDLVLGCMAVSGTYNGASFQLACEEGKLTVGKGATHIIGCQGPVGSGDLVVELHLDPNLVVTRGAVFSTNEQSSRNWVSVWHLTRQFASYPNDMFKLAQTHEQSFRVAGISERVMGGSALSPREEWRIRGAFALSLTPKSSCAPDGMGRGCDEVKLRAQFNAFPIK